MDNMVGFSVGDKVCWTNGERSECDLTIVRTDTLSNDDRDLIDRYAPPHLKAIDTAGYRYLLERTSGERFLCFYSNLTIQPILPQ